MFLVEVIEKFVGVIEVGYDLIVINYVNFDMVGYIGDFNVVMVVCSVVDMGLKVV